MTSPTNLSVSPLHRDSDTVYCRQGEIITPTHLDSAVPGCDGTLQRRMKFAFLPESQLWRAPSMSRSFWSEWK